MSTAIPSPRRREAQLAGQTDVVIGGSAGIGLETARLVRAEGATLVLTARNPERLQNEASKFASASTVAFDATDFERLAQFFDELPAPIDHLLLTGPGPYYAPLADFDFEKARRTIEAHVFLPLQVARHAASKVRPGGTLLFMGGTGGRHTAKGFALISALTACRLPKQRLTERIRERNGYANVVEEIALITAANKGIGSKIAVPVECFHASKVRCVS